jgi:glucan 1,3-beta-glucosidase
MGEWDGTKYTSFNYDNI